MKKILLLFMICVFCSCFGKMEMAQYNKAREAEENGLPRKVMVYEQGKLTFTFKGLCNLEYSETRGYTITEIFDGNFLSHKINPSNRTLIIIEELPNLIHEGKENEAETN